MNVIVKIQERKNEIVTSAMSPYIPVTGTCNVDLICSSFVFNLKMTLLCFSFMLSGSFHVITDLHLGSKPVAVGYNILLIFLNNENLLYCNS